MHKSLEMGYGVFYERYKLSLKDLNIKSLGKIGIPILNHSKSLVRQIITESFELISEYAEINGKDSVLRAQDWYQFARMIRNAYKHNHKLDFNKYDKTLLPVKWVNKKSPKKTEFILELYMEGFPIDVVCPEVNKGKVFVFSYEEILDLFYEMQDFAKTFK